MSQVQRGGGGGGGRGQKNIVAAAVSVYRAAVTQRPMYSHARCVPYYVFPE